jgi:Zn-dependent protease
VVEDREPADGAMPNLPWCGPYPEERRMTTVASAEKPRVKVARRERYLGPFLAVLAALSKFGAILLKFKILGVAVGMLVSVFAYVWYGGIWFGIGLVILLFVHEMGHVIELRRQGLPASMPIFIPFLGALISMKKMPKDAWNEAKMAIAGPILGSLAALACWFIGIAADSNHFRALAFLGFFVNLFNLLPVVPLDGGRVMSAIHPFVWVIGFLAFAALAVVSPNPLLLIILFFCFMEMWRRWKLRYHPTEREYYRVKPWQRLTAATLYFGLAALLVLGMAATHVPHSF